VVAHVRCFPGPCMSSFDLAHFKISARRLTVGFVEAGGCVPEKFNAVEGTSNIDAEYGNQVRDAFQACFFTVCQAAV
jgi:hypothetical protein